MHSNKILLLVFILKKKMFFHLYKNLIVIQKKIEIPHIQTTLGVYSYNSKN